MRWKCFQVKGKTMIEKIISGGQTGADLGALVFARERGIQTGGFMPKGWLTEEGPRPDYKDLYGLVEVEGGYRDRTERNLIASDAVLLFALNMSSPGSALTLNLAAIHHKPCYQIQLHEDQYRLFRLSTKIAGDPSGSRDIANWLIRIGARVLNVAGNRESRAPGIGEFVRQYLGVLFDLLEKE